MHALALVLLSLVAADDSLRPGDHARKLTVADKKRVYYVHVPAKYDPKTPTPVVLVLHGAMTDGKMMEFYCGLDKKADEAGFIAVYPNGTGYGTFLTWNCGGIFAVGKDKPNDVEFIGKVLDDLATVLNVNPKRVYATGISNGGMMSFKLAAEMSDRIAAIAPVAGTMTFEKCPLKRPVSVMAFHGTDDGLVPFGGTKGNKAYAFRSADECARAFAEADGCSKEAKVTDEPHKDAEKTKTKRKTFGPGTDGAEVVMLVTEGGGHTWPGAKINVDFLGKTTHDISANDLMWEFFEKHEMK